LRVFDLVTSARAQDQATEGPAETHVGEAVHESVGHPAEDHGGFPPFEPSTYGSQLLWLAITFGLLYWLLSRIVLPRIAATLEERDTRVAGDLATAGRLKGETDAAIAAYEQALAEARQRAQRIAQGARDESKASAEADRGRIEADLNGRLQEAETRIAGVKTQALANVDTIANDAAGALVETLLGPGAAQAEIAAAVNAAMVQRSAS
jgi:F-type H+-transporting ATPase subunit b